jgi:hypothetical protein
MDTKSLRIDATVFSDNPFASNDTLSKALVRESASHRLYKIIISLGHAWAMYYTAPTPEGKSKAMLQVNLLETERSRVLGMMVN